MRVAISIVVILALAGFLVADGASMYGAHRKAANVARQAAERAAQTYVDTGGSEDAVHRAVQTMAVEEGVELVSVTYYKRTTRWYEVTVRALGSSYLLRHIPGLKNYLVQESTAVAHF
jgi:Flp pilus assembly protein TadG